MVPKLASVDGQVPSCREAAPALIGPHSSTPHCDPLIINLNAGDLNITTYMPVLVTPDSCVPSNGSGSRQATMDRGAQRKNRTVSRAGLLNATVRYVRKLGVQFVVCPTPYSTPQMAPDRTQHSACMISNDLMLVVARGLGEASSSCRGENPEANTRTAARGYPREVPGSGVWTAVLRLRIATRDGNAPAASA